MKPDEPPSAGQPTPDTPPASLTVVRVGRRKGATPASGKAGDLTQRLGANAPDDASAAIHGVAAPAPAAAAPLPPTPEPPRAVAPPQAPPAPLRAVASPPPPKPLRAVEPPRPVAKEPPAHLLGEDEIRQLLDPPERRAAPKPPPALAPEPPLMVEPDEREAIPPAPTAPELRLVVEAPAPEPMPDAPAERPPVAAATPSSIDQIIDYWDGLRGGKPVPPLTALDRAHVGRSWPNCMLVAYGATDTAMPKLTRIGEENGEIEYLEMVIHWILSRGQLAARRGEPMEEEKRFPVTGGNARYQLLLLPLANSDGKSEHVLCHLSRVKEVAKGGAFKRWLAS
jgi:hypothetical protein